MSSEVSRTQTSPAVLERLLEVTRKLATRFELGPMLAEVIEAGRAILDADRGSVFLYDAASDELCTFVATGIDGIRFPASRGIAGSCARTRLAVSVPDCYADPRFNAEVDQATGYRTSCLLSVPLIGHDDKLVGVLQLLNKRTGVFTREDEDIASALAAQCAVALQRVRMTAEIVLKEKLEKEMSIARDVQLRVFPTDVPQVAGYDIAAWSRSADQTGGDIYDLIRLDARRLLLLLGDATGHGIGPALSITQFRAMLRMGVRLGASLDDVFVHINNQLADDLADNRFITAFLGVLDADAGAVTYHAGGQGPLLLFHAATGECEWRDATTIPMGMIPNLPLASPATFALAPGDIVGLLSDGIFEYPDASGQEFGQDRVAAIIREHGAGSMDALIERILLAVEAFGVGVAQPDDMTMVVVRRG